MSKVLSMIQISAQNCPTPDVVMKSAKIIRLAWLLVKSAESRVLSQNDLSYSQFTVLFLIQQAGNLSQKQVADHLELTEAAISRLAETLQKKQYLTRLSFQENRRENHLQITPIGEKVLELVWRKLSQAEEMLFKEIPLANIKVFQEVLTQLVGKLEKTTESHTHPSQTMSTK